MNKVSLKPLQRLAGSRGRALGARRRVRNPLYNVRSARGESKNSPVDYFWRGEALKERASPSACFSKPTCCQSQFAAASRCTRVRVVAPLTLRFDYPNQAYADRGYLFHAFLTACFRRGGKNGQFILHRYITNKAVLSEHTPLINF